VAKSETSEGKSTSHVKSPSGTSTDRLASMIKYPSGIGAVKSPSRMSGDKLLYSQVKHLSGNIPENLSPNNSHGTNTDRTISQNKFSSPRTSTEKLSLINSVDKFISQVKSPSGTNTEKSINSPSGTRKSRQSIPRIKYPSGGTEKLINETPIHSPSGTTPETSTEKSPLIVKTSSGTDKSTLGHVKSPAGTKSKSGGVKSPSGSDKSLYGLVKSLSGIATQPSKTTGTSNSEIVKSPSGTIKSQEDGRRKSTSFSLNPECSPSGTPNSENIIFPSIGTRSRSASGNKSIDRTIKYPSGTIQSNAESSPSTRRKKLSGKAGEEGNEVVKSRRGKREKLESESSVAGKKEKHCGESVKASNLAEKVRSSVTEARKSASEARKAVSEARQVVEKLALVAIEVQKSATEAQKSASEARKFASKINPGAFQRHLAASGTQAIKKNSKPSRKVTEETCLRTKILEPDEEVKNVNLKETRRRSLFVGEKIDKKWKSGKENRVKRARGVHDRVYSMDSAPKRVRLIQGKKRKILMTKIYLI